MSTRSDGDDWDIVSSVGRTALGVATVRALESERPDPLIDDPFARWFVEAAGDPHFTALLADPSPLEAMPFFFPGFMGLRTRYFDDYFVAASAGGIRQAVVLASGLDDRAYRLPWQPGTVIFEIDRASVLDFKQAVLDEHDVRPRAELRTVAVDLREDWPAALADAGFDAHRPTAWSAEGLLAYLPGPAHDALFARIDAVSAPGSRVALNDFGRDDHVRQLTELRERFGGADPFGGVDVTELFYDDARASPADWLGEHGWWVEPASTAGLAERYGTPIPPLPPDLGDLEEFAREPTYLTATKR